MIAAITVAAGWFMVAAVIGLAVCATHQILVGRRAARRLTQVPVDAYGASAAPPTTTPPGGGLAEIVAGVTAAADTPATFNPSRPL